MTSPTPTLTFLVFLLWLAPRLPAQEPAYLKDYAFIVETVEREGAAIRRHDIVWKKEAKAFEDRFAACTDDVAFVELCMRLLAICRDAHTGVVTHGVDRAKLPSKWDVTRSCGLWIVEDGGRFHVAGVDGDGIDLGSCLTTIDAWPAWLAMERERRRVAQFQGLSSDHSWLASIGNRFVPMGDARSVALSFVVGAKRETVTRGPWGPSGRGFDTITATAPAGLKREEGAVATMLPAAGETRVGYLRITGAMDAPTVAAFHQTLDTLRDMDALVLDCRGMGGGGDGFAWEIAGRFFPKGVDNGRNGRIEASGAWQFDGPVVMLQDAREVSSAETFTWAMSETGRAISVGQATGGWSIIPRAFRTPSGKLGFRLGVTDRGTPIQGVRTEGVGWPPDVLVPLGPLITSRPRWPLELATSIARCAHESEDVEATRELFALLPAGRIADFSKRARALAKTVRDLDLAAVAKTYADDLELTLELERTLLTDVRPPDVLGCTRRLRTLAPRAKAAGAAKPLAALERTLKGLKKEAAAQEDLLAALDADFGWSEKARAAFLDRHAGTSFAAFAKEELPARE